MYEVPTLPVSNPKLEKVARPELSVTAVVVPISDCPVTEAVIVTPAIAALALSARS